MQALAKDLVQRSWLSPYQMNQVLQGRAGDLVFGPYVLLERIGEGGIGKVFKARHLVMKRVVALKVIRKEKIANPDAVRRFTARSRRPLSLIIPTSSRLTMPRSPATRISWSWSSSRAPT